MTTGGFLKRRVGLTASSYKNVAVISDMGVYPPLSSGASFDDPNTDGGRKSVRTDVSTDIGLLQNIDLIYNSSNKTYTEQGWLMIGGGQPIS